MMKKTTTRHKPPSRIRYEESHPVMSCRLPKADFDLLKQRLEELKVSFATFVKDALGRLEITTKEIKDEAYNQGYNRAKEEHQIWYNCCICRKRIYISPNGESHKAIRQYMQEHRWGHANCHEKQKKKSP